MWVMRRVETSEEKRILPIKRLMACVHLGGSQALKALQFYSSVKGIFPTFF
jgi:hypothetical protein